MELQRDIYKELLAWKERDSGKVLELKGARQTGKTFILDKFARENYSRYIYINMVQSSGKAFLLCMEQAMDWNPGEPRIDKPLHRAFQLFSSSFVDDKDTIIVIDEIQESAKVYSSIREFSRKFNSHFVVTGSYLGKTVEKDYFLPAGDTEDLVMNPLSFPEFLGAVGKRELYEMIDLYGEGRHEDYDLLRELYQIYSEIGGYPEVVARYVETSDKNQCREQLMQIIRIFIEESTRYLSEIPDTSLFEQLFPAIAQLSAREKKGNDDLIAELSKMIYNEESNRATKKGINYVVAWLYRSDVIGYCGKAVECDPTDTRPNVRFYFRDLGVARYFLRAGGVKHDAAAGFISENFVYLDLLRRTRTQEIAGTAPMFGTYKTGEIDFLVSNTSNDKDYGVEVKAGRAPGKTAQQLLRDNKVEAVYFLKGDTYGGIEGRMLTVPIYLAGRITFNFIRELA